MDDNKLVGQLNDLNAKLIKAEMMNDTKKMEEFKLKIKELKDRFDREEIKRSTSNQAESEFDKTRQKRSRVIDNKLIGQLNELNAKLIKAEMMNDTEKIEEFKLKIKELKERFDREEVERSISNQAESEFDKTRQKRNRVIDDKLVGQLNELNAKLIKAEMMNDTKKMEEFKLKIKELKERFDREEIERSTSNQAENESLPTVDVEMLNKVNQLKAKVFKAELLNDKKLVDECKKSVTEIMIEKGLIKNENEELPEFSFTELFENLIQANKRNDKNQIDQCKDKILKFEYGFNFKKKDDLVKLVRLSGDCLNETVKLKSQEEMNGNLKLVNDLDKRAKAIRKKNIEYTAKLEELIKTLPVEPKPIKSRVDPKFGKPEPKKDNVETRTVIRKLDGSNMSLQQMFVSEKNSDQYSEDKLFMNTSGRIKNENDEYDDSGFKRKKLNDKNEYQLVSREEDDSCGSCLDRIKDRLIIAYDEKVFMIIPEKKPLLKNQLIIRSFDHCPSLVAANEDVIEAVNQCKQKLCTIFDSIDMKLIFVEYYYSDSKSKKHFEIVCFPIPEDQFEQSKMYFKKGILESEGEWSMNKKLIFLKNESIHKKLAKNLSYFSVTFGPTSEGFAHVIEDKKGFPRYFAEEILGGMLDIEPHNWTKPGLQDWSQQEHRSTQLKKLWSKLDVKTN